LPEETGRRGIPMAPARFVITPPNPARVAEQFEPSRLAIGAIVR
jgi:hypothetical protein